MADAMKSIDTSRAAVFPGVHAVVTAADLVQYSGRITDISEGTMNNVRFMSNNTLAVDKVLYKGHAMAAVAATSVHVAMVIRQTRMASPARAPWGHLWWTLRLQSRESGSTRRRH